jgi:hypothetical protein
MCSRHDAVQVVVDKLNAGEHIACVNLSSEPPRFFLKIDAYRVTLRRMRLRGRSFSLHNVEVDFRVLGDRELDWEDGDRASGEIFERQYARTACRSRKQWLERAGCHRDRAGLAHLHAVSFV